MVLTGDKGGLNGSTKVGFIIADVLESANSPGNFSLLGWYKGDDDRASLEKFLKPLFLQLKAIKEIRIGNELVPVEL